MSILAPMQRHPTTRVVEHVTADPWPLPVSWQGRCTGAHRPRSAIHAPTAAAGVYIGPGTTCASMPNHHIHVRGRDVACSPGKRWHGGGVVRVVNYQNG